jgi:hypothetical protein
VVSVVVCPTASVAAASVTVRSSLFGQIGCTMSGAVTLNASNGFRFVSSFGSAADDNVFAQEVAIQRSFYSGIPATVYIMDEGSVGAKNAYALGSPQAILFGYYMYHYTISQFGGLAVAGVLAHEWGHRTQYTYGWQYPNPTQELEADAFSGFYMALAKGWAWSQIQGYFTNVYLIGDYNFNSPQHHGTGNQRLAAAYLGVNTAVQVVQSGQPLSYQQLHSIFVTNIVQRILPNRVVAGVRQPTEGSDEPRARAVQERLAGVPLRRVAEGETRGGELRIATDRPDTLRALWPKP